MSALCPHCGFDLKHDEQIIDGDWIIDPRGVVTFQGSTVGLTVQEALVVLTIAKAAGRPLKREVISNRIGSKSYSDNLVAVLISRIKAKINLHGAPYPFRNVWGAGLAWHPEIAA